MRTFMLLCLATVAIAAPQGYNYAVQQQQQQHHHQQQQLTSTNAFLKDLTAVQSSAALEAPSAGFAPTYPSAVGDFGAVNYAAQAPIATPSARYLAPTGYAANNAGYEQRHQAPIVSKRFFIHSAPEEPEEPVDQRHLTIGQARKNFNVVFIKAPAKHAQRTSLKITPAVNEDKTVIYVLAKKPEDAQIDAQVLEHATTTAKPEVFFIKYKTNEEAEHAQRSIQSQYDSLGGSTQISNEGFAPVSSVIGSLDAAHAAGPVDNAYLPPAKLRQ